MALSKIKTLRDLQSKHYQKIENAVSTSSKEEIEQHYALIHSVAVEDISEVSIWSDTYVYPEAGQCCVECDELELAIASNIAGADHKDLIRWFPKIANSVLPPNSASN